MKRWRDRDKLSMFCAHFTCAKSLSKVWVSLSNSCLTVARLGRCGQVPPPCESAAFYTCPLSTVGHQTAAFSVIQSCRGIFFVATSLPRNIIPDRDRNIWNILHRSSARCHFFQNTVGAKFHLRFSNFVLWLCNLTQEGEEKILNFARLGPSGCAFLLKFWIL